MLVVGFVILMLGNVTTYFKVNTDIIADELAERFQENKEESTKPSNLPWGTEFLPKLDIQSTTPCILSDV